MKQIYKLFADLLHRLSIRIYSPTLTMAFSLDILLLKLREATGDINNFMDLPAMRIEDALPEAQLVQVVVLRLK